MLLLLIACSEDFSLNYNLNEFPNDFGWQKDNFAPVKDNPFYGGICSIQNIDNLLILDDDNFSYVQGMSTRWDGVFPMPRLFISKIGSYVWDTLPNPRFVDSSYIRDTLPNPGLINTFYANKSGLYVGLKLSAQVLKYDFANKTWKDLHAMTLDSGNVFTVYGIASYKNKLVVSIAGYETDKEKYEHDEIRVAIKLQSDSGWVDITPPYDASLQYPLHFYKAIELNGALYATTAYTGVWKYDGTWTKLPSFPKPNWFTWQPPYDKNEYTEDIVAHKGKLYAISAKESSIFEYDETLNEWADIDSILETHNENIPIIQTTPHYKYALASSGDHLFVVGNDGYPRVYMGDYGAPYGNEVKGWRRVDAGWFRDLRSISTSSSYGMVVVKDTLYLANWKQLLKFPLRDLDEAIKDRPSYPVLSFTK